MSRSDVSNPHGRQEPESNGARWVVIALVVLVLAGLIVVTVMPRHVPPGVGGGTSPADTGAAGGGESTESRQPTMTVVNIPVAMAEGRAALNAGNTTQAAKSFTTVLDALPEDDDERRAETLAVLGLVYQQTNQWDKARDAVTEALDLAPERADVQFAVGRMARLQRLVDVADIHLSRAVEIKPDYRQAWAELAQLRATHQRHEKAVEAYSQAVDLDPENHRLLSSFGGSLAIIGRNEDAERVIRRALELKPDYAEGYYNLGMLLQRQGLDEQALDAFGTALELKPDYELAERKYNVVLKRLTGE